MFDRVSVYEKFQKEINEKPRFSLGLHPGGQGIICFFQTEISGETLPFLFPWRDQETTMVREFQLALGW